MARFKFSAMMFVFFAMLASHTFFRFDIRSRPLHVLQGIIDTTMTSWLGDSMTALVLAILAFGIPVFTMRKSYEVRAQFSLNSTKSALKGKIYKPSRSELAAVNNDPFAKRL
jgi:hypothetical protein